MLKITKKRAYIITLLVFSLVFLPTFSAFSETANIEKIQDSQLVVLSLDNNSEISEIQVLKHLRAFGSGNVAIEHESKYQMSSIRNLFGREKVAQKDKQINVEMSIPSDIGFQDVYYLAKVEQEELNNIKMPVKIDVAYYLDGNKVQPSELTGKSGKLRIVVEAENLTGEMKTLEFTNSQGEEVTKEAEVFTPYAVSLSGWQFDNKKFANIQAPGVAGESPEGVILNVKGVSTVSWTLPLIPPKFPSKQYAVLEADARDIELNSFNIGVIPILPTTSEIDSLGTIKKSLSQLYDGFDTIQGGIGSADKDASLLYGYNSLLKAIGSDERDGTILYGLNAVKGGLDQISGGIGSVEANLLKIRKGLSNPSFKSSTYESARGADANGNTPGVKDAIVIMKDTVDSKVFPGLMLQKLTLTQFETTIGKSGDSGTEPSANTSLFNDINQIQALVKGTEAEKILNENIKVKLSDLSTNIAVLRDGGKLITAGGSMDFPASVTALETGMKQLSGGLGKANEGMGMMVIGMGMLDTQGQPMKVMVDGKPGNLLFALSYLKEGIDEKLIPGVSKMHQGITKDMKPGLEKMQEGTAAIGEGSGKAKDGIATGLLTFDSIGSLVSVMEDNAEEASTFIGSAQNAETAVAYIYQTPAVNKDGQKMTYGLILIALSIIAIFALGRGREDVSLDSSESQNKNV